MISIRKVMMYKFIMILIICISISACEKKGKREKEANPKTSELEYKLDEYFTAFSKIKEFNGNRRRR